MEEILDQIKKPNDIKQLHPEEYKQLACDIRHFLLKNISHTGGHLASNLGAVELTMALHLCLDLPKDKLVWDVGHQAYTHKILTGRKDSMDSLRQYKGISGFPKRKENESDAFDTGHSSTSISVALGLAAARDIQNEEHKIFAVIGDGALSGGMAFEALNNAASLHSNVVIVLNDNKMSISQNVGGMANYLGKIRSNNKYQDLKEDVEKALRKMPGIGDVLVDKIRKSKDSLKRLFIPGMLFEDMGLTYIGAVDGHNVEELMIAFQSAMKMKEPVLVHVNTKKGKGYRLAEKNPSIYHGVDPFYVKTGKMRKEASRISYTNVFSDCICELARDNDKIVAISAAMPNGTGLNAFAEQFPKRFFDVGIAEEHAVTFAAGLAAGGLKPVVAIYSTFLQRAYDQILHDVCIGGLPVVFAIDRSGIVGNDGETHQGIYDISFLSSIPGMTICAPKNKFELKDMLAFCMEFQAPIAIRYPRGSASECFKDSNQEIVYGKSEVLIQEKDILLLAVGSMVSTASRVYQELKQKGYHATVINMRFIKPFDQDMLKEQLSKHTMIVSMEENAANGSLGQQIGNYLMQHPSKIQTFLPITLPDQYIEQGSPEILKERYGMDAHTIVKTIEDRWNG